MRVIGSKLIAVAILAGMMAVAGQAQDPPKKEWTDRAEYDLAQEIAKTADHAKKIDLIKQWQEKYPKSAFNFERLGMLLTAYQGAGKAPEMKATALEMIQADPNNVAGYLYVCLLTESMGKTDEQALADGEKGANGLLEVSQKMAKPANVTDAQWEAQKKEWQLTAYKTLGFVKMTRADYPAAEAFFDTALKATGNPLFNLQAATAILRQKKPERQPEALFHYARAGTYTGPGALPDAAKKQAYDFFRKNYVLLREDDTKMEEFIALTKQAVVPPPGLKIESVTEEIAKEEERLKTENPQLALWIGIKKQLIGAEAEETFKNNLKDAALPKMKGRVVSHTPDMKPHTIVLAMEKEGTTPQVTLKLDVMMPGKADPGTELEFEGVSSSFAKDPFMLTVEVEKGKLYGWPVAGTPTPLPAGGVRPPMKKGLPLKKK